MMVDQPEQCPRCRASHARVASRCLTCGAPLPGADSTAAAAAMGPHIQAANSLPVGPLLTAQGKGARLELWPEHIKIKRQSKGQEIGRAQIALATIVEVRFQKPSLFAAGYIHCAVPDSGEHTIRFNRKQAASFQAIRDAINRQKKALEQAAATRVSIAALANPPDDLRYSPSCATKAS